MIHPRAPLTGSDSRAGVARKCEDTYRAVGSEHCSHCERLTELVCCMYAGVGICELWTQHMFSESQNHTGGDTGRKAAMSAKATSCHSLKPPYNTKKKVLATVKTLFSLMTCCCFPFFFACSFFHVFCCLNLLLNTTAATETGSQEITLLQE